MDQAIQVTLAVHGTPRSLPALAGNYILSL
ncbi:MAG: hypothetical protein ACRERY_01990 [Pseudomonas sp.]